MIIKVSDIDTNPYRKIEKYPIKRDKVDALKCSISQTGFWDNVLVRPYGSRYQLAYGHHRLVAIKELGLETIDAPVKELDDATMLRIMANENMDEWKASPSVINETVLAAKEFIDAELAKYDSWPIANKNISDLYQDERSFRIGKSQGAGQTTILAFLGGNWKQWMIQEALETLKADKEKVVDRKAAEVMQSTKSAQAFRKAVKEYDIPYEEQLEIAEEIVNEERDAHREVKQAVKDILEKKGRTGFEAKYPAIQDEPLLSEYLEQTIDQAIQVYTLIGRYFEHPEQVSQERMSYLLDILRKINQVIITHTGGKV